MAIWTALRTDAVGASDQLHAGLNRLLEINRQLEDEYGSPDLGNKQDPVDELVYIILSRRTRESAYQAAFVALKKRFSSWDEVVTVPPEAVEAVIRPTGLGRKKASSIKQALSILSEHFGTCTLGPTASWTDDEIRAFLCSLPEVGPKSAACVMMWSLGRAAFPVDTHVGRVLERVGIWSELGLSLRGAGHKAKQAILADLVPPTIRLSLHVNALVHGRAVCRPVRPLCERCRIAPLCDSVADYGVPGRERLTERATR
jgi:endonuclease III